VVFWVITPCSDVVGYQRFGVPYCLHLLGEVRMEAAWPSEMLVSYHFYVTSQHRRPRLEYLLPRKPSLITCTQLNHENVVLFIHRCFIIHERNDFATQMINQFTTYIYLHFVIRHYFTSFKACKECSFTWEYYVY